MQGIFLRYAIIIYTHKYTTLAPKSLAALYNLCVSVGCRGVAEGLNSVISHPPTGAHSRGKGRYDSYTYTVKQRRTLPATVLTLLLCLACALIQN